MHPTTVSPRLQRECIFSFITIIKLDRGNREDIPLIWNGVEVIYRFNLFGQFIVVYGMYLG